MILAAVLLTLASATCYATASVLQHRAAQSEQSHAVLDPRLLVRLLRRPVWLAGGAADLGGAGLQASALVFGPLSLVQPLLVSGLVLAVPLDALLDRRRPDGQDLRAVVLSAAGLAAFILMAQPRPGLAEPLTRVWPRIAVGSGVVILACLALARGRHGSPRAALLGIATGVLYAVAAALVKASASSVDGEPLTLLMDWRIYAFMAVGLAGVILNQNAFQAGPLAGALTAIVLVDPLVSLIIAVTAFQEELSTDGLRLWIELAAIAVMARGVWLASMIRESRPQ